MPLNAAYTSELIEACWETGDVDGCLKEPEISGRYREKYLAAQGACAERLK
jgi:hypothetical protein